MPSLRGGNYEAERSNSRRSNLNVEIASSHDSPSGRIMLLAMTKKNKFEFVKIFLHGHAAIDDDDLPRDIIRRIGS